MRRMNDMSQVQPRTPGRETANVSSPGRGGPSSNENIETSGQSTIYQNICILIHSNDGKLRCTIAGDGTWLSVSDRKSKRHTTRPLKIQRGCKLGVISADSKYILLVDVDDGIWLHHLDTGRTCVVKLPNSLVSEFDTVGACRATREEGVFLIATEKRIILFEVSLIGQDVFEARVSVRLCMQGFESNVVTVSCPCSTSESDEEYIMVQTNHNVYVGKIDANENALVALYEDIDEGPALYGNSTAMAISPNGPLVAIAMQGKEVHVWQICQLINSYEKHGFIDNVAPIILHGFEEDVTRLLWSTHGNSRYLVTSEPGKDCMVWNFEHIQPGGATKSIQESMVCSSSSRTMAECFHQGSMTLVLLGDDETLSFYQTTPFLKGNTRECSRTCNISHVCENFNTGQNTPALLWENGNKGDLFLLIGGNLITWDTTGLMDMCRSECKKTLMIDNSEDTRRIGTSSVGPTTPVTISGVAGDMYGSPFTNQCGSVQQCPENPKHIDHPPQYSEEYYHDRCSFIGSWNPGAFPGGTIPYMCHQPLSSPPTGWMHEEWRYRNPRVESPASPVLWGYSSLPYLESYASRPDYLYTGNMMNTSLPCSSLAHHPVESTVYIGNIPAGLQADSIGWMCSQYGHVFDVQLIKDNHSALDHKGYAFVTFSDPEMAQRCIQKLHGQIIRGHHGACRVRVAPSKRKPFKKEAFQ